MSHVNPAHHPGGSQYPPYSPSMASHTTHPMQYPQFPDGVDGRSPPPPPPPPQGPGSAPPPPHLQYYPTYPMQQPGDPNAPIRYPLPPHPDGRLMSGGRHKKEIKRRTKTGCLTCRKRRIKCDEGHPTCRNCQKSKRDCMGYDPIFKPQPGPPSIQSATPQYSPMAQPPPSSYPAPPSRTYSPAAYGAPILDNDSPTSQPSERSNPTPDHEVDGNGNIKQEYQDMKIKIESLLCIAGVAPPPPAPPSSLPEETKAEIKKIYSMAYALGMDKFFETRWFSERGLDQLLANSVLCDQFAMLTHRFAMNPQDPSYPHQLQITQSLEAMVVWSMLGMSRKVAATKDEAGNVREEDVRDGVLDASKRIEIFQALITGEYQSSDAGLDSEPRANGTGVQGQLESRGHKFWHHVHRFLTLQPDSPEAIQEIEANLTSCRTLLDSMENRDVIYSIMVARYYGPKVPGFPQQMRAPETNDEKDIDAKLAVAKRLLEDEAAGRGTNQVVQRLCGAAVRSWYVKR